MVISLLIVYGIEGHETDVLFYFGAYCTIWYRDIFIFVKMCVGTRNYFRIFSKAFRLFIYASETLNDGLMS
jgi:hypothetical protein